MKEYKLITLKESGYNGKIIDVAYIVSYEQYYAKHSGNESSVIELIELFLNDETQRFDEDEENSYTDKDATFYCDFNNDQELRQWRDGHPEYFI